LVSFQIDNGKFPTTGGKLSVISDSLTKWGLSSIPTDPNTARSFSGIATTTWIDGWEFGYTPIKKNGQPGNGFVLMAGVDTEAWANRVFTGAVIDEDCNYADITLCKSVTQQDGPATNSAGACTWSGTSDVLRYIVLY
jgi:hypothetical protein